MAIWNRNTADPDGTGAEPSAAPVRGGRRARPAEMFAGPNGKKKRQQGAVLAVIGGAVIAAGLGYVWSGDSKTQAHDPMALIKTKISTDEMVNRTMADKAWRAQAEVLQNQTNVRLKAVEGQAPRLQAMQAKIDTLTQQNVAMQADGQKALSVYAQENARQRDQLEALKKGGGPAGGAVGGRAEPFRVAGASPAYGPSGGYDEQGRPVGARGPGGPGQAGMPSIAEVKTISFGGSGGSGGGGGKAPAGFEAVSPDAPPTVIEASADYLPPNSYAPARVIVGVDASAGVQSQTDPLPVVLRITGPARSVVNNGRVLTTKLEGCVVNGAARGDLSAEKIYVKLAKMTCDQPGGRVAVSEVKGFISFGGKTGVRGRVVTREGGLIGQAFLAGIAGGFGRAFTANTSAVLQGSNVTVNGQRELLGPRPDRRRRTSARASPRPVTWSANI